MEKVTNIFEQVIASAARMKEIRDIRYKIEVGTYVPGMYKKLLKPHEQAVVDVDSGLAGREYLYKAASRPRARKNIHDVKTR